MRCLLAAVIPLASSSSKHAGRDVRYRLLNPNFRTADRRLVDYELTETIGAVLCSRDAVRRALVRPTGLGVAGRLGALRHRWLH
jgi:hypothetical protein